MMKKEQRKSVEKTEQLLLYITKKLEGTPNFGSILLNKALYYIDNISYLKYKRAVSHFNYVKQKRGPTPSPSLFVDLRDKMISERKLEIKEVERFGKIQKRLVPLIEYDIDYFTSAEVDLIDNILEEISEFKASEISDYTHDSLAWKLANIMEDLPFYTFLLTESDLEASDIKWAQDKITEYKALSSN